MGPFSGRDVVALVIAFGAVASVLAIAIGIVTVPGSEVITPAEGELLAGTVGAVIGAVATYLGGRKDPEL